MSSAGSAEEWAEFLALLQNVWSSKDCYSKNGSRGSPKLDALDPDGSTWQLTKNNTPNKGDFFVHQHRFSSMTAVRKVRSPVAALLLPVHHIARALAVLRVSSEYAAAHHRRSRTAQPPRAI